MLAPVPNAKRPLVETGMNRLVRQINGHVRTWCVAHACNSALEVMQLVEGQAAVGMKPYVLAGDGSVPLSGRQAIVSPGHSGSLLTAWNEVREWRKLLVEPDVAAFELVHAHAFPAGMAAVRNCPIVVYDIHSFVESKAGGRAGNEFTWLARSFRVAEQFVIARAGAVVVHSHSMRQGALERGAGEENLFQLPEPLDSAGIESLGRSRIATSIERESDEGVTFFAPDACVRLEDDPKPLPGDAVQLLEAFAILSGELPEARLFVQADAECVQPLYEKATALGVAGRVYAATSQDRERALAEADAVIALSTTNAESTVLMGLLNHRAVLAADIPAARDASAEGCGVLWYRLGDMADLARRAAFLARNPDFRIALTRAGRKHLLETRTPEAVARRYHSIYRRAWDRRRTGTSSTGMNLQPLTVCL